jgi:hypothetical protein
VNILITSPVCFDRWSLIKTPGKPSLERLAYSVSYLVIDGPCDLTGFVYAAVPATPTAAGCIKALLGKVGILSTPPAYLDPRQIFPDRELTLFKVSAKPPLKRGGC